MIKSKKDKKVLRARKMEKAEKAEVRRLLKKYKYFKEKDVYGSIIGRFYRHLGGTIALKLMNTKVKPYQITIFDFFLSLVAAYFFYLGTYPFVIYGSIILFVVVVLDYADGSLARIRKKYSSFGSWLDTSTDTLTIVLLVFAIALGIYNKTQNFLVWILAFLTITSFFSVKLLYIKFNKYAAFSNNVITEEKKKHRLRSSFYFIEAFFFTITIIAGLLNIFYYYLIFCSIYGWLFYFMMFFILTRKIKSREE